MSSLLGAVDWTAHGAGAHTSATAAAVPNTHAAHVCVVNPTHTAHRTCALQVSRVSLLYETAAMYMTEQPAFLNAAVLARTDLPPPWHQGLVS